MSDPCESVKERTRVGHCKQDDVDQYAGRGPGNANINTAAPGAVRGWLGNPYTLDDYTREESIEKFREDFEAKLENDEAFREAVADLSGSVLGCWCQRLDEDEPACHAEIIAEHADRMARSLDTGRDRSEGDS